MVKGLETIIPGNFLTVGIVVVIYPCYFSFNVLYPSDQKHLSHYDNLVYNVISFGMKEIMQHVDILTTALNPIMLMIC
jgi:hypothetical protein